MLLAQLLGLFSLPHLSFPSQLGLLVEALRRPSAVGGRHPGRPQIRPRLERALRLELGLLQCSSSLSGCLSSTRRGELCRPSTLGRRRTNSSAGLVAQAPLLDLARGLLPSSSTGRGGGFPLLRGFIGWHAPRLWCRARRLRRARRRRRRRFRLFIFGIPSGREGVARVAQSREHVHEVLRGREVGLDALRRRRRRRGLVRLFPDGRVDAAS